MPNHTAAWLIRYALEELGVRHTFGIPGVHNIELYDELASSRSIEPVLVTHEMCGSFMADAVSRTTDSIGALAIVPAAGVTHAMSGIGEAFLGGVPMLVIAGGVRSDTDRRFQLHDVDHEKLLAALTKARFRITDHASIVATMFEAYDIATSGEPGPVFIEVPANLQLFPGPVAALPRYERRHQPPPAAPAADLERAAELLLAARRPGLFVGWGARHAIEHTRRIAERLGAPVATTLQGLTSFPSDHPLHVGMSFGRSAVPAAENAFMDCDALLAVGVRFAEIATGSFGVKVPSNLIHIDINRATLGANYPAAVAIHADAAAALERLGAELRKRLPTPRESGALRASIAADKSAYRQTWLRHNSRGRVNPAAFFDALAAYLAPDALIVADDGNHTFLCAELLPTPQRVQFISPTDFNSMGYCVPAAIGAKLASPKRQVIGVVGDGAFLMSGMEIATAAARGLGCVFFVFSDGELSQIAQAQEIPYGRRTCTNIARVDLEAFASAVGAAFVRVRSNLDLDPALATAFTQSQGARPVIVDVCIDYSKRTRFTDGTVKTNLERFSLGNKARFISRALLRRVTA
jgi:acetolactate synthase-1/2/3 large subunit